VDHSHLIEINTTSTGKLIYQTKLVSIKVAQYCEWFPLMESKKKT